VPLECPKCRGWRDNLACNRIDQAVYAWLMMTGARTMTMLNPAAASVRADLQGSFTTA